MKQLVSLLILSTLISINGISQEIKKDFRPQNIREDEHNLFKTDQISKLDILEALKFSGINIYKFKLGQFDKKYIYYIMKDEYLNGKILNTDTIVEYYNEYRFYKRGEEGYFIDYIDQIKVFTKKEENKLKIRFETYALSTTDELSYKKTNDKQFFNLRPFINTTWALNKKIPLLVFASSWEDKKYAVQRFCGSSELEVNDKESDRLLSHSPHYFLFSYKIVNVEDE